MFATIMLLSIPRILSTALARSLRVFVDLLTDYTLSKKSLIATNIKGGDGYITGSRVELAKMRDILAISSSKISLFSPYSRL